MKVLKEKSQISAARRELASKGASIADPRARAFLRRLGWIRGLSVGEIGKSWDVLETISFLEQNLSKDKPVLDIGAYASEVIVALHKLGYLNLTGADLDPKLKHMPFSDTIHYEVCDFMATPFADRSFNAITSISVIEHGFDGERLLNEVSRLLRPGGYFISSFDYWQSKIDTSGIDFFGMSWNIFSEGEIVDFIELANVYGFTPVGALDFQGKDALVHCGGKDYTFGWLALQKAAAA